MRGSSLASLAVYVAAASSLCAVSLVARATPPAGLAAPSPALAPKRSHLPGQAPNPGNTTTARPTATAKQAAPTTGVSPSHGRATQVTRPLGTNPHAGVLGGPARSTGFKSATNATAIPGAVSGTGLKRRPGAPAH
jgi:hypothetical protein